MSIRTPSLNLVLIAGNLTDDPRQNILENGVHVANFRVASNQYYKGRDGEFHKKTCYVDVVCWRKTAEIAADRLRRGSPVMVEGELQNRSWKAQDGSTRNVLEILARRIQFLEKEEGDRTTETHSMDDTPPPDRDPGDEPIYDDDIPF
jgi:single-strand DNA-binding protein